MVIDVLVRSTEENFEPNAYLLANPDIAAAKCDPVLHFQDHGRFEVRHQINPEILHASSSYRNRKYSLFSKTIDHDVSRPSHEGFPLFLGDAHFSLEDYQSESANSDFGPFVNAIDQNPEKLFLDLGCGLRSKVRDNCLYVEVYLSITADVVVPPKCHYPFMTGAFDGIGCFAVLEHTRRPWDVVLEMRRMLKPGGQVWIDWPFLQPVHGYPSHFFNATREGLVSIFEDAGFKVLEAQTGLHQGPDYTVSWILHSLLGSLPQETRTRVGGMSVYEVLSHPPSGPFWTDLMDQIDATTRSTLACGNWMFATKLE